MCYRDGFLVLEMRYNDGFFMVIEYGMLSGMMIGFLIKWFKDREIK